MSITARSPKVRVPSTRMPQRRSPKLHRKQTRAAYLLTLPFVIVFLAMFVAPLAYSGYLSTFRSELVGGTVFVGLGNYVEAVTDPLFLGALLRMCLFLAIQVPIMIGLALFFALALDSGMVRAQKFIRLAIFVPYAVPGVVAALMWGYLYGPNFGPIGQVIRAIGLPGPDLLSSGNILPSIMNIVTWEFVGYNMIILYAALRAIPAELYDAAQIDGAGRIRTALSIKIPMIRSALLLTIIFSIIGVFQLFNEPQLLYNLAPNSIGTSFSPNLYAYTLAFTNQNVNYAAAIAFVLGIVIMIVSYVVQLLANRGEKAVRA